MEENKSLVGYSGFVGSNLCANTYFNGLYDSKNIEKAYNTEPELLVYSGVPAQKYIANKFPEKDFEVIENAINNIRQINPKKIVLISTIDVYAKPDGVNEDTEIQIQDLQPYGKNRYYLEKWVKENYEDYLIVHLPALYGINLKKNFIYDMINIIPSMLNKEKLEELIKENSTIKKYYENQNNGFYKCKENLLEEERKILKDYFMNIGFSALNFTDSRASYQFYNLKYLWSHIEMALKNKIKVLNLATEPIKASELYEFVMGENFNNEILVDIPHYDFKTKYATIFGSNGEYIFDKQFVLEDVKKFMENEGI